MNPLGILLAIGALLVIIVAGTAFHYLAEGLAELEHHFLLIAGGILILILAAGTYLGFAVPSLAKNNPFTNGSSSVSQDSPIGFPSETP